MNEFHSDISGFYKLSLEERQNQLAKLLNLGQKEIELLQNQGKFFQDQLNEINKRIKELETKEKEK